MKMIFLQLCRKVLLRKKCLSRKDGFGSRVQHDVILWMMANVVKAVAYIKTKLLSFV